MKVYEASKLLKRDSKEFIKELNDPRITSHLSKLPPEIEAELFGAEKKIEEAAAEPTKTVDSAETVMVNEKPKAEPKAEPKPEPKPVVEIPSKEDTCPVDLETLELSIRGIGGKSPYYKWKHLLNA